jgi:hypothetical protein
MADSESDDYSVVLEDEDTDEFADSSDDEENVKPAKKKVATAAKAAPEKNVMNYYRDDDMNDFCDSSDEEEHVKPTKKKVVAAAPKKNNTVPTKTAPKKTSTKTTKITTAAKGPATDKKLDGKPMQVLGSKENNNTNSLPLTSATTNEVRKEKTVEEKYQKKSQIEHILLRPDTYGTFRSLYLIQYGHLYAQI